MNVNFKYATGDKLKDLVSGFEGICFSASKFLNGCIQYGLKGRMDKDGKLPETQWFDEGQLEMVQSNALAVEQKENGGPMDTPPG